MYLQWVRHTNGLWLPVQFLVAVDEEAGAAAQEGQAAVAGAQAGSAAERATGAASEGDSSLVADGAAAATAVDDARNAQQQRLERLRQASRHKVLLVLGPWQSHRRLVASFRSL